MLWISRQIKEKVIITLRIDSSPEYVQITTNDGNQSETSHGTQKDFWRERLSLVMFHLCCLLRLHFPLLYRSIYSRLLWEHWISNININQLMRTAAGRLGSLEKSPVWSRHLIK